MKNNSDIHVLPIATDVKLNTDHHIIIIKIERENDLSTCEDTQMSGDDDDTVKQNHSKKRATKKLAKHTIDNLSPPVSVGSNTQSMFPDFPEVKEQSSSLNNFSEVDKSTHQETILETNNFLDVDNDNHSKKSLSLSTNDFTNNLSEIENTPKPSIEQTDIISSDDDETINGPISTSVKSLGGALQY